MRKAFALVANDRTIKPKNIKNNARLVTGTQITYNTAWRVKQAIGLQLDGDGREQFRLILPMVRFLTQYAHLLNCSILTDEVFTQITAPGSEYDGAFTRVKKSKGGVFEAAAFLPTAMVLA